MLTFMTNKTIYGKVSTEEKGKFHVTDKCKIRECNGDEKLTPKSVVI